MYINDYIVSSDDTKPILFRVEPNVLIPAWSRVYTFEETIDKFGRFNDAVNVFVFNAMLGNTDTIGSYRFRRIN